MSNLVAISYDDKETAGKVVHTLDDLVDEHAIELDDAVVVSKRNGKVELNQSMSPTKAGAAGGAVWGGLIGLLFLAPFLGMAIGAAAGAGAGALTDVGVDDKFMKDLGDKLDPNGAALILLVRKSTPDKVLPRIQEYGGHVIQTSLSNEQEEKLRQSLGDSQ